MVCLFLAGVPKEIEADHGWPFHDRQIVAIYAKLKIRARDLDVEFTSWRVVLGKYDNAVRDY